MRYRLIVLIFFMMSLLAMSSDALAIDGDPSLSATGDHRLLPVSGQTIALSGLDRNGLSDQNQHVSNIEAIPTPTAFHTGTVLLLVILGGRVFRKLRLARLS